MAESRNKKSPLDSASVEMAQRERAIVGSWSDDVVCGAVEIRAERCVACAALGTKVTLWRAMDVRASTRWLAGSEPASRFVWRRMVPAFGNDGAAVECGS